MVINKNLDKSLWLMMMSSNDNRLNILSFIRIIPTGMYNYILTKISEYESYFVNEYDKTVEFENKSMLGVDGYVYDLKCSISFGVLKIQLHRYTGGMSIDEKYELEVVSLCNKDLTSNNNIYVGSYGYECLTTDVYGNDDKHIRYRSKCKVKKIPFDRLLVSTSWRLGSKIIPINSIPMELYLDNFSNKLVKRKKKKLY